MNNINRPSDEPTPEYLALQVVAFTALVGSMLVVFNKEVNTVFNDNVRVNEPSFVSKPDLRKNNHEVVYQPTDGELFLTNAALTAPELLPCNKEGKFTLDLAIKRFNDGDYSPEVITCYCGFRAFLATVPGSYVSVGIETAADAYPDKDGKCQNYIKSLGSPE